MSDRLKPAEEWARELGIDCATVRAIQADVMSEDARVLRAYIQNGSRNPAADAEHCITSRAWELSGKRDAPSLTPAQQELKAKKFP